MKAQTVSHTDSHVQPKMIQRVPRQIGFTMQCPYYSYQGYRALLRSHPVLSTLLRGRKKRRQRPGVVGTKWERGETISGKGFSSSSSLLWLPLRRVCGKCGWTEEFLQSPSIRTLFLPFSIASDPHLSVRLTSRTFSSTGFLLTLPHLLASLCIWCLWAWGDLLLQNTFTQSPWTRKSGFHKINELDFFWWGNNILLCNGHIFPLFIHACEW